jgi:hypothetical protein
MSVLPTKIRVILSSTLSLLCGSDLYVALLNKLSKGQK